jgi:SAM-dependent methyltransferase
MLVYEQPELTEFFLTQRSSPEDLYPSERRFLPELAAGAESVLDVGCAAGGFVDIWRAFNPDLRYTGVDVSEALVAAARRRHPDAMFLVGNCAAGLSLPDRAADVVAALGWLHWEPRYADALCELWRLTGRSLFFDVRLHDADDDIAGVQEIPGGETSYLCVSWPRFAGLLAGLAPSSIRGFGYFGPPAASVRGVPDEVCFAAFVLERGDGATRVSLDLPLEWPIPNNEGANP